MPSRAPGGSYCVLMGLKSALRRARPAAGLGAAALLVVGCSAAVSGSAVLDSTAAMPAPTTGAADWSTAEPLTPAASSPARSATSGTSRTGASTTTVGTGAASSTGRPAGDLGLTEMISQVSCDGSVIVLLGSATTPRAYTSDVQKLLQIHPGSHYLRTDRSCGSLTQQSDDGHPIYAVFYGPYGAPSKACEVLRLTGSDAQVRVLTDSAKPLGPEKC
jgi:serine/threonine-protein kinase